MKNVSSVFSTIKQMIISQINRQINTQGVPPNIK